MGSTRREFVSTTSAAAALAGLAAVPSTARAAFAAAEAPSPAVGDPDIRKLAHLALDAARTAGVVKTLNDDRYWTQRKGVSPTARGGSLRMSGGSSILYTVRTRDGTFLIAHGRITRAVKNLRFDDSPVFMLNHLEALGTPVRVGASEDGGPGQAVMVPRITVRDFTFTSSSDAA